MDPQTKKHIYIHLYGGNGTVSTETTVLLLGIQQVCYEIGVLCTISITNSTNPSYWGARNKALEDFKVNKDFTHLLFLNDKISVDPRTLIYLLSSDHNVCGLVAPLGVIRWTNLLQKKNLMAINTILQDSNNNENNLKNFWTHMHSNINMYNVIFKKDTKIDSNGWIEVDSMGTDIMLLKRNVVERLPSTTFRLLDDSGLIDQSFNDELKKLEEPINVWTEPMVIRNNTNQFIGRIKDAINMKFELAIQPKIQEISDCQCTTCDCKSCICIDCDCNECGKKEYQPPID